MDVPGELKYSEDHEWARLEANRARIGITDYAQDALGDVVFVQLPEVGSRVESKSSIGEVESTKSVSDVYAPVAGEIVEVNDELAERPELLNSDPYGSGWICVIKLSSSAEAEDLLDAEAYRELTGG